MDRIVYLGPYNNNKKEEFFEKSIKYLRENKGDKFYYILPNGNLLIQYGKAMINEVEKTLNLNLFTFDDIADRLIEDNFYLFLDGDMKEAFLVQILLKLREENKLNYYKNISTKKGFVKILSNIIGEIKQSLITPEEYLNKCPREPFYMEIGLIYREYESALGQAGLIDREGSFSKSLEILKKDNRFFEDLDFILIDEFFDFRPQEMELLREISKTDLPIYINMPFGREENFHTLNNTLEILKDLGFEIQYIEKENENPYEKIANKLFTNTSINLNSRPNIKLIKANSDYLELKKIAEEIKYHYSQGIDLEKMSIIMAETSDYKRVLHQVFKEEKIPYNMDKDISLIEIPLIRELLYILELKNDMDKNSIINRVKSNYFTICSRTEREALEYVLRKTHFNTLEDMKNSKEILASIYWETIENIIGEIQRELELIPEEALMEEYIELIGELIDKFNIEEKILNIYNEVEDYDLLYRDFLALEKLNNLIGEIEKLNKIFSKEIPLEKFIELIENYFQNETIIELEGNHKGINILTPTTARGQIYDVVFIIGLAQSKYPNLSDENFFFREKNYNELKKIGIDYKNYYEKLDKEALLFSTAISSCTNYLYLSYFENASGEEKDIASMFLDELIQKIEEDNIEIVNVDIDYLIKDNTNELTTKKELIKYFLKNYYEEEFTEEIISVPNYINMDLFNEINHRLLCEMERERENFNQYSGNIEDINIAKDIENIHRDKVYSISYLESYGKCPYFFLLNNILQVEEMERELMDFTPIDRGIINHEILKNYYIKYKVEIANHILGKEIFDIDNTYEYIQNNIIISMKALDLDTESNLWKMRIENSANNILNFIKADLDRLTKYKNKILPLDYELDFGWKRPFYIEKDGFKIPMVGKIDRIDKYIDEDKYIIIDYKNTKYSARSIGDIIDGISLQLPVYIMSQEDKNVVAGIYGIISDGELDFKIMNIEEKELIGRKRTGIVNEEELEELLDLVKDFIVEYVNNIYKGDFSINPKECSPYCIYRDICRYKEKMEDTIKSN